MDFDSKKRILGDRKLTARQNRKVTPASGIRGETIISREDSVEIRVGDKKSFEKLVRDQIKIHEVNAAASATPLIAPPSTMADMLAAVEAQETSRDVEAAFEEVDATESDEFHGSPDGHTLSNRETLVVNADGPDGAMQDNAEADRDTLKPVRSASDAATLNPSEEQLRDSDVMELSGDDLIIDVEEDYDDEDDTKRNLVTARNTDIHETISQSAHTNGDRIGVMDEFTGEAFDDDFEDAQTVLRRTTVIPLERGWDSRDMSLYAVSSDEQTERRYREDVLQSVRTSVPPPPGGSQRVRRKNPWKVVSFIAIFLVVGMGGWMLYSSEYANPGNAKSDYPAGIEVDDAHSVSMKPASMVTAMDNISTMNNDGEKSDAAAVVRTSAANEDVNPPVQPTPSAEDKGNRLKTQPVVNRNSHRYAKKAQKERPRIQSGHSGVVHQSDDADSNLAQSNHGNDDDAASDADDEETVALAEPQSAIPELPTKAAVRAAMKKVLPMMKSCRSDKAGKLVVQLVVSGATGKVMSSQVIDETFRGTATGLCVARAVQSARLPIFQKEQLTIKYPFELY
ncbi:MAG: hypothetical protein JXR76_20830 [Deltaproteobacteria bacterium]|nr:hypothetical protein [Deltaproteobacteria bacterium]